MGVAAWGSQQGFEDFTYLHPTFSFHYFRGVIPQILGFPLYYFTSYEREDLQKRVTYIKDEKMTEDFTAKFSCKNIAPSLFLFLLLQGGFSGPEAGGREAGKGGKGGMM